MNKADLKKISIIEKIKSNKKLQYFLIFVLCAAVILIFFTTSFQGKTEKAATDAVSQYVSDLERRLENALKKMDGVGNVSVVISVESGMETVLASKKITEEKAGEITVEETPVLVNGKTVVLKENYPPVSGVLIVAEGANRISVMTKILQATTSLLNIEAEQIEIMTMKK